MKKLISLRIGKSYFNLKQLSLLLLFAFIISGCQGKAGKNTSNPTTKESVNSTVTKSDAFKDAQQIQPSVLAEILNSEKSNKLPLILQIGILELYNQGHIPGSVFAGPASDPDGLQKLREQINNLPKDKFVVLYCGCCPWNNCPNVKPAYEEMKNQGFTNLKLLYIPKSFTADWADKNYPVEVKK